jgi:Reverse transcriptase (RNA-dependent DNA polymerase)
MEKIHHLLKSQRVDKGLFYHHISNIFINDIPLPKNCQLAMFTDDTALFCDGPWKKFKKIRFILESALSKVSKFFLEWKIMLNAEKTEFIIFTQSATMIRRMQENPPSFKNCKKQLWKQLDIRNKCILLLVFHQSDSFSVFGT